jgi:hypothetical protein
MSWGLPNVCIWKAEQRVQHHLKILSNFLILNVLYIRFRASCSGLQSGKANLGRSLDIKAGPTKN